MDTDYKTIDLTAWTQVGEGGNGATYTNPAEPGVILKVSHRVEGTYEVVSKEFYTSKAVYDLGLPTPQMLEMVRVGDEYGIKSQLIAKKKSIARLSGEDDAAIDGLAARLAEQVKQLHSTVATGQKWLPSMKEQMLKALATTRMVGSKTRKRLTEYVESLEDAPTLLHGDLSLGNLIIDLSDDKPYWIDLGRAAHGLPIFDLAHLYLYCTIFSKQKRVQEISHMTTQQLMHFWDSFALAYNGPEGLEAFTAQCRRHAGLDIILLGYIQTLNWHERLFLSLLARLIIK